MKTANELKSGIFASPAMLLRGADYVPPEDKKEEKAALEDPDFGKGGPGSGRHPGSGEGHKANELSAHAKAASIVAGRSESKGSAPNHIAAARAHERAARAHQAEGRFGAADKHLNSAAYHRDLASRGSSKSEFPSGNR